MKKMIMLAMVCSLATGAFANNNKPKKLKKSKQQCTQQVCPPACKPSGCCTILKCAKV